jgi:hypothetical protein
MNLNNLFSKVVFLIGAGASFEADCKMSATMLKALEQSISNIQPDDIEYIKYKSTFSEIYRFIIASLQYQSSLLNPSMNNPQNINIEDFVMVLRQLIDKEYIIPYPLIGNWNDKIIKWELWDSELNGYGNSGNVFQKFKKFITHLLVNDWTQFDVSKAECLLAPIQDLLISSEPFKMNIFSLNYDLVFENILNDKTKRIIDNGFSEKNIDGIHIKYWANDFNDENSLSKINLYKLHGSLDWEYNDSTEEISIKENILDDREPLIIFGSYSKMLSFDPFLYILSKFRESLEDSTIFVVIGYSFHDKYINNLLIQQLSQNSKVGIPKKLIIVNPSYKGKTSSQVSEELQLIQASKSINDIINFRHISPDRIKVLGQITSEFFKEYFSNHAEKLIGEVEETEKSGNIF